MEIAFVEGLREEMGQWDILDGNGLGRDGSDGGGSNCNGGDELHGDSSGCGGEEEGRG